MTAWHSAVEYEEIFVRRFDAWLHQEPLAMRAQALNFGVDGYNTLQIETLVRERVLDFQPVGHEFIADRLQVIIDGSAVAVRP